MVQLSIPEAAVALGVSVDTVRRRIKAGLLRARRDDHGTYVVDLHDAPANVGDHAHSADAPAAQVEEAAPAPSTRPMATDEHLFKNAQRRASDFPQEIQSLRVLLEVERQRNEELREHLAFQRRQLEKADADRERLVAVLETQQQQFGIEQLQRILAQPPTLNSNER
jgi:excisionase family DNA binding protein